MTWDPATMLGADGLHPNDTGMTYLADTFEDALIAAGRTPSAGDTIYAYGDSWTASDFENTPGMRAIEQLRDRYTLTLTNKAVSGYKWGDVAARGIGTGGTYPPGASDYVLIQAGVNDLQQSDTTQQRDAIENYMRGLLAVVFAAQRIEEVPNAGTTGSWTVFANAGASAGENGYTQTNGATATYNIATAGDYYFLTCGRNDVGGVATVSQGGVTLGVADQHLQHVPTGKSPVNSNYGPMGVKLDPVSAGSLLVSCSNGGRAGAYNHIDAFVRQSTTNRPTVLLVKPVEVTDAGYQNATLLAYMRDLCDTLGAEFGADVIVVDPAAAAGATLSRVTEVQTVRTLGVSTDLQLARIEEAARVGALSTFIALSRVVEYDEAAALQALPVVTALPPRYADALTMRRDKAFALPTPSLVDGRIVDDWEVAP